MIITRACIVLALFVSACAASPHTAADHTAALVSITGPLQRAERDCVATIPAEIGKYEARARCINNAYDRIARAVYPFPVLFDRAEESRLHIARSVDEGRRTPQEALVAQEDYDRIIANAERNQLSTDAYRDEQAASEQREATARNAAAALLIFGAAAGAAATAYHPVYVAPQRTLVTHCSSYAGMTDCITR